MKKHIVHLLKRIAYWTRIQRDDYGKPGDTQFFYRSLRIRQDDLIEPNLIGFYDKESGPMKWMNIHIGKTVKDPFKRK